MTYINQQTMVNLRGRLVYISPSEVDARRSQGWKVVNNPRRDYFPEFDTTLSVQSSSEIVIDDLNEDDVLPGEEV